MTRQHTKSGLNGTEKRSGAILTEPRRSFGHIIKNLTFSRDCWYFP
ncbi:hypothetical protein X975_22294, partial [Stegodyphus mimosarum]